MKKYIMVAITLLAILISSCAQREKVENKTAINEQAETEKNQANLFAIQPPPKISWSLERDNLIKRFLLQNDRSIMFYMYIFIEGVSEPIGYYKVNKVSSVNSQLTNTEQIIIAGRNISDVVNQPVILPSPAEDGSYGTNGDAVFGFTPEEIYIEHNMKYIVATVPLTFQKPVNKLAIVDIKTAKELKMMMDKIRESIK